MTRFGSLIQELTGVDIGSLKENDRITLDVPLNRIVIDSNERGALSFDVTADDMNGLVQESGAERAERDLGVTVGVISIVVGVIGIVVGIVNTYVTLQQKCKTVKTTTTYRKTTTYTDGTTTTEEWITETTEEQCEDLPSPPQPVPPSTQPHTPECCPLCGEQLVPGKKHYCK